MSTQREGGPIRTDAEMVPLLFDEIAVLRQEKAALARELLMLRQKKKPLQFDDIYPTHDEVRAERERTGVGGHEIRHRITVERLEAAIANLDDLKMTETEQVLAMVIRVMLKETHR